MSYRNLPTNFWAFAAAGLFIIIALFYSHSTAGAQTSPSSTTYEVTSSTAGLFSAPLPLEDLQNRASADNPTVARERTVTVNFEHLTGAIAGETVASPAIDFPTVTDQLLLNLFADVTLLAVRDTSYQNSSGSYTWIGHVADDPYSVVILVFQRNTLYGTVQSPVHGEFAVQPVYNGNHLIQQARPETVLSDSGLSNSELSDRDAPHIDTSGATVVGTAGTAPFAAQTVAAGSVADDGSVIDVLVVHSDDVAAADAQGFAELFTAYTNQAYVNSDIAQRIWLVGVESIVYAETGNLNQDLNNVTDNMPEVIAHRDAYHADLVVFFVSNGGSGCSSASWTQTAVNLDFADSGFAVMNVCSNGSPIFARALGRTMGARRDWYFDNGTTPFPYAHGYVDPVNHFRTIMAAADRCGNCDSIPYFANPAVTYHGAPTGVAAGTAADCAQGDPNPVTECDADVRLTFAGTAANTAQFRNSELIWTGAVSDDWYTAGNWVIAEGAPGTEVPVNRLPRAIDNLFIPNNVATMPTINGNAAVARELIIDDGATLTMYGGTLTVGLRWQDQGGFQGMGGTVIFDGPVAGEVVSGAGSTFANVQIGNGSGDVAFTLAGNLDINGDLTFKAKARLSAGSHTIRLAGNWLDEGNGFRPETSTVIFDGTAQIIYKTTTTTLLSQDFSDYASISSQDPPDGWEKSESDGLGFRFSNGEAIHSDDSTDAWLFTPELYLQPGVLYTVQFDVSQSFTSNSTMTLAYGTEQFSGAMSNQIGTLSELPIFNYETNSFSFTPAVAGNYSIGFHSVQDLSNGENKLDNISIAAAQQPTFYDLQIQENSQTTLFQNLVVNHDLQIDNGAMLDMDVNTIVVDGALTNNGTLKQRKAVAAGSTTEFLYIQDSTATIDQYRGVDITSAGTLGITTVAIRGSQVCAEGDGGLDTVQRCYAISPTTAQPAQIRFYYQSVEENNNPQPNVYRWNGASWELETVAGRGGSDGALWVAADNIDSYAPFRLDDPNTTAVPTATSTPTSTSTPTLTATPTATPSPTLTATPSPTASHTATLLPTFTPTVTPTVTPLVSATPTDTVTPTPTTTAIAEDEPGDCNGDTVVNAGDLTALTLEIFDGDGEFWLDAPAGTFVGTEQCDANQDLAINAGDLTCTVLLIFNGPGACTVSGEGTPDEPPPATLSLGSLAVSSTVDMVTVPVELTTHGNSVASVVIAIRFDATRFVLNTADQDQNAIPDAITLKLPPTMQRPLIAVNATTDADTGTGMLYFSITDIAAVPAQLQDGTVAAITFQLIPSQQADSVDSRMTFDTSTSLGNAMGQSIPVTVEDGIITIEPSMSEIYLPFVVDN